MNWIRIQINTIDFALSSLLRRKWRIAVLILVYGLVVFMISSALFFANALRKQAMSVLEKSPEIVVQKNMAGRHELISLEAVDTIRSIRGVRRVKPRLWGYYYHPASRSNFTLLVPETGGPGDNQVEIGSGVLRAWGSSASKEIYLTSIKDEMLTLEVVKVLEPSVDLVAADLILMSENTFRKLTGMPQGYATDLAVGVRNQKECLNIARKIKQLLPGSRPILRNEMERTYASLFDWRSGYVLVLLGGGVLSFFIFAWDKATGLSAEEKKEIGILRALGWSISDILVLKFWEGAIVSLTAFFLGVLAAYGHVFLGGVRLFEHALKGWAVVYPRLQLQPSIDAYQIGTLLLLTVMPYALMVVIPCWRVATTDPDLVMRMA